MTIIGNFEGFQNFNSETNFLKNANLLQKTRVPFCFKLLRLTIQHFHTKLLCQKPVLRQIECGVPNGSIAKNGV